MDNLRHVLQYWGLENADVTPIEQPAQTAWDVGGKYILKRFRNKEDFTHSTNFSKLLSAYDIPVTKFISTKSGELTPLSDEFYFLMTKIPGSHVNFYNTPKLADELGRELALLHIALSKIEKSTSSYDSNLLDNWQNNIKPSLGDVPEEMVQYVDNELQKLIPRLPRQLIHRDVHPENVLFEGDKLSGWLDFDLSHKNIRIFDIAYFLAGLLVNNTNDSEKVENWHNIQHYLIHGYKKVTPLTDDEVTALPVIMMSIEFLFAWFWGTQNNVKERNIAIDLAKWLYQERDK